MNLLNWVPGRSQGIDCKIPYRKLCLWWSKRFDLYLIDYPAGSGTSWHTDDVQGRSHHRLNIVLQGPTRSFIKRTHSIGPLNGRGAVEAGGRVNYFRPDVTLHRVLPTLQRRLVLSLGWTRPLKDGPSLIDIARMWNAPSFLGSLTPEQRRRIYEKSAKVGL